MIRGMYSAASALVVASEQQEVTAANLANATVPGYRERGLVFESFDRILGRAEPPTGDIVGARSVQTYHDFRPGPLQQTGNPFDLALGDPDRARDHQGHVGGPLEGDRRHGAEVGRLPQGAGADQALTEL